jgi:hypothetical protein
MKNLADELSGISGLNPPTLGNPFGAVKASPFASLLGGSMSTMGNKFSGSSGLNLYGQKANKQPGGLVPFNFSIKA